MSSSEKMYVCFSNRQLWYILIRLSQFFMCTVKLTSCSVLPQDPSFENRKTSKVFNLTTNAQMAVTSEIHYFVYLKTTFNSWFLCIFCSLMKFNQRGLYKCISCRGCWEKKFYSSERNGPQRKESGAELLAGEGLDRIPEISLGKFVILSGHVWKVAWRPLLSAPLQRRSCHSNSQIISECNRYWETGRKPVLTNTGNR